MARKKFLREGIEYDSQEEVDFTGWLEEAKLFGYVDSWIYQPESFILAEKVNVKIEAPLKTKTKIMYKSLLREHKYTADFKIQFNKSFKKKFPNNKIKNLMLLNNNECWIDIKGGFGSFGSHSNFSVESKWVWEKYGVLVEKLVPSKFFKNVWVPEAVRFTPKTKKERKKYKGYTTFEDVAKELVYE